jgi:hypothetical protein
MQRLAEQIKAPVQQFTMTASAVKCYENWWDVLDQDDPMVTRLEEVVKKLLIVLARSNDVSEIDERLVNQATALASFVLECRRKFNPQDAVSWVEAREHDIRKAFKKHGPMSLRECRQRVSPHKKQGGLGPYLQAQRNLLNVELFKVDSLSRNDIFELRS